MTERLDGSAIGVAFYFYLSEMHSVCLRVAIHIEFHHEPSGEILTECPVLLIIKIS